MASQVFMKPVVPVGKLMADLAAASPMLLAEKFANAAHGQELSLAESEKLIRKAVIIRALAAVKWNQCEACKLLGVHRNTLHRSMRELVIEIPEQFRRKDQK